MVRSFTFSTFIVLAALFVSPAMAMIQKKDDSGKSITAFSPPNLNWNGLCKKDEDYIVNVKLNTDRVDDATKFKIAKTLLRGRSDVFPDPVKAIRLLRELADSNGEYAARAKFQIARLYLLGEFLPENRDKTIKMVEEVAPTDPAEAGYFLARLYQYAGEHAKAEDFYKRSALAGNPLSYMAMAYLYREDLITGVSQERINQLITLSETKALELIAQGKCKIAHDFGKAFLKDRKNTDNHVIGVKWLEAAAKAENVSAISYLGRLYLYGVHVKQDVARGLAYYERGAAEFDAESLNRLGRHWILKDNSTAQERSKGAAYLEQAARQGHRDSIVKLVEYYRGLFGDTPQPEKAVALMERALAIPDVNAEIPFMLGEAYATGDGAAKDEQRAFQLFARAAGLNYRDALVKLGEAYKYGIGVKRRPMKSYRFYRQAASAGSRDAMLALIENYSCGIGKAPDKKYASFWHQRALHEGTGRVLWPVVRRLMLSKNKQENTEGFMLLKRRAAQNDREAMVMLSHFYSQGIGVEKSDPLAQKWQDESMREGEDQADGFTAMGEAWLDPELFGLEPKKAESYLMKAMKLGTKDAGHELGRMYLTGFKEQNFPQNLEKSEWAFRDAAKRGNDNAMRKLAQILIAKGEDVEAIKWLEKSASLHNMDSILAIYDYYVRMAVKDETAFDKALYWRKLANNHYSCTPRIKARMDRIARKFEDLDRGQVPETIEEIRTLAQENDRRAMRKLAQRYMLGAEGGTPNPEQALKWYLKAAKAGDSTSMMEIGNSFSTGLGVSPSRAKAREWWKRAADAGNKKAARMLEIDSSIVDNAPAKKMKH